MARAPHLAVRGGVCALPLDPPAAWRRYADRPADRLLDQGASRARPGTAPTSVGGLSRWSGVSRQPRQDTKSWDVVVKRRSMTGRIRASLVLARPHFRRQVAPARDVAPETSASGRRLAASTVVAGTALCVLARRRRPLRRLPPERGGLGTTFRAAPRGSISWRQRPRPPPRPATRPRSRPGRREPSAPSARRPSRARRRRRAARPPRGSAVASGSRPAG